MDTFSHHQVPNARRTKRRQQYCWQAVKLCRGIQLLRLLLLVLVVATSRQTMAQYVSASYPASYGVPSPHAEASQPEPFTHQDIPLSAVTKRYCLDVYEIEFAEQLPAAPHFVARGHFQPCPGNSTTDDGNYLVFLNGAQRTAKTKLIKTDGQANYLTPTYYRLHHLSRLLESGEPLFVYWGRDNKRRFASRMEMLHRPFCTLYYLHDGDDLRIRCKRSGSG